MLIDGSKRTNEKLEGGIATWPVFALHFGRKEVHTAPLLGGRRRRCGSNSGRRTSMGGGGGINETTVTMLCQAFRGRITSAALGIAALDV